MQLEPIVKFGRLDSNQTQTKWKHRLYEDEDAVDALDAIDVEEQQWPNNSRRFQKCDSHYGTTFDREGMAR